MAETYRADNLGSLLRSAKLKEARAAFDEGRLSQEDLRQVEDGEILTFHAFGDTHKLVTASKLEQ